MADALKSKTVAIGTTATDLLSAVSGGETVIHTLQIGNVDGAAAATVDLYLNENGGGDVLFLKGLRVEAGKSVVVFSSQSGKLTLEDEGTPDALKAIASAAGDLVALISYVERT